MWGIRCGIRIVELYDNFNRPEPQFRGNLYSSALSGRSISVRADVSWSPRFPVRSTWTSTSNLCTTHGGNIRRNRQNCWDGHVKEYDCQLFSADDFHVFVRDGHYSDNIFRWNLTKNKRILRIFDTNTTLYTNKTILFAPFIVFYVFTSDESIPRQ